MIEFLMKKVLLIGLSVLLFGGIFLILRTGKEPDRELRIAGGSFIEDIRILQKKNGVTLWDLTASRADFENEDRARLSNVSISLRKNGVVLFADKGYIISPTRALRRTARSRPMGRTTGSLQIRSILKSLPEISGQTAG